MKQNVTIINIFIPIRYCGPVAQEPENNAIFLWSFTVCNWMGWSIFNIDNIMIFIYTLTLQSMVITKVQTILDKPEFFRFQQKIVWHFVITKRYIVKTFCILMTFVELSFYVSLAHKADEAKLFTCYCLPVTFYSS